MFPTLANDSFKGGLVPNSVNVRCHPSKCIALPCYTHDLAAMYEYCLNPENRIAKPFNLSFKGGVCTVHVSPSFNVAAPLPYISGEIEERSVGSNLGGE